MCMTILQTFLENLLLKLFMSINFHTAILWVCAVMIVRSFSRDVHFCACQSAQEILKLCAILNQNNALRYKWITMVTILCKKNALILSILACVAGGIFGTSGNRERVEIPPAAKL